jgi:hypothetical protein
MTGFIAHLWNLLLHFTNYFMTHCLVSSSSTAISRDSLSSDLIQNQSYFTTGGLPPISSSWRQAPWGPRPEIFFQQISYDNSPYVTPSLTRRLSNLSCRRFSLYSLWTAPTESTVSNSSSSGGSSRCFFTHFTPQYFSVILLTEMFLNVVPLSVYYLNKDMHISQSLAVRQHYQLLSSSLSCNEFLCICAIRLSRSQLRHVGPACDANRANWLELQLFWILFRP